MTGNVIKVLAVGLALLATKVAAETPIIPYPAFTFKMIGVPPKGTKNLITVQINPAEQAARLALTANKPRTPDQAKPRFISPKTDTPMPDLGVPGVAPGTYSWYWDRVSPKLDFAGDRFDQAITALSTGPDGKAVAAPRLQAFQEIANRYGPQILSATIDTNVSPALVLAVISVESGGNAQAVSPAGAKGLMQLIPATASRFGVADSMDPAQNIKGGVAYLDWLMGQFNGDPVMVLAAYNAGENRILGGGGVPDIAETRDYVPKVLAAWTVAKGLCMTPPDLVSDGCVFVGKG